MKYLYSTLLVLAGAALVVWTAEFDGSGALAFMGAGLMLTGVIEADR